MAITQAAEGFDVLQARAKELGASSFTPIPVHPELETREIKLGLAGDHQRINASLAIALVRSFLASPRLPKAFKSLALPHSDSSAKAASDSADLPSLPADLVAPVPLPAEFVAGLEQTRWPGRCQVELDPTTPATSAHPLTWYLDGAHTVESLKCCGEWFGAEALVKGRNGDEKSAQPRKRALVFNCTSGRSGHALLGTLVGALRAASAQAGAAKHETQEPFHHVIFCTNTTFASGDSKGGESWLA